MCLIVDANTAVEFFCGTDARVADLRDAVFSGRCCVIYGGTLLEEYGRIDKARRVVLALDRAGRAQAVPDGPVAAQTRKFAESGKLESDDPHILALAVLSGSRLLHSFDRSFAQGFYQPGACHISARKSYKARFDQLCTG